MDWFDDLHEDFARRHAERGLQQKQPAPGDPGPIDNGIRARAVRLARQHREKVLREARKWAGRNYQLTLETHRQRFLKVDNRSPNNRRWK